MKLELQQQDFIEVYPSESGYVAINQTSAPGEEDCVLIRPDDIPRLVRLLRIAQKQAVENRLVYTAQQEVANDR